MTVLTWGFVAGASVCFAPSNPQGLLPKQADGTSVAYIVTCSETDYSGSGTAKKTGQIDSRIPLRLRITNHGQPSVEVTEGPLIIRGRSVGRARLRNLKVDRGGAIRGSSPAYFSVPFPVAGAVTGQSWKAGFFGPAPLPGGLKATYHLESQNSQFAKIHASVDSDGACHVTGWAELLVRLSDGYLDHGKAEFDISYVRPDPQNRTHLTVNSHNALRFTIDQR